VQGGKGVLVVGMELPKAGAGETLGRAVLRWFCGLLFFYESYGTF